MKKVFLTFAIGLMTMFGFGQNYLNGTSDKKVETVLDGWFKPYGERTESEIRAVEEFLREKMAGEYTFVSTGPMGHIMSVSVGRYPFDEKYMENFIYGYYTYFNRKPTFMLIDENILEIEMINEENTEGMYFEFRFDEKVFVFQEFIPK